MKRFLIVVLAAGLAACSNDADVASRNLSQAADNFEINRRIVFYNGITGEYLLPEPVKDHVRKGDISASLARNIAKGVDPVRAAELIRANLEENRRIKGKRTRVTKRTIERDRKPKAPARAQLPAGMTVTGGTEAPGAPVAALPPEQAPAAANGDPVAGPDDIDALARAGTPAQARPDQALIESTRAQVAQSNGWHPDAEDAAPPRPQSQGVKDLIEALRPFAEMANDHDLNAKADDDLLEVFARDVKRAWTVYAAATGGQQ